MKKCFIISLMLVLIASLIIGGCAQPAPKPTPGPSATPATEKPSWPKLTILTPPSGTNPNTLAVVFSTIVSKYEPGLQIRVEPGVGAAQASVDFLKGNGDICYLPTVTYLMEIPNYIGGKTLAAGPLNLMSASSTLFHIVTRTESGINSVADFKGKKILGKIVAGTAQDFVRQELLAAYGMKDNDIVLLSGDNASHLAKQLQEGVGDAALMLSDIGERSIVELCTAKNISWISLPLEKATALSKQTGFSVKNVTAGTYPNQDKDVLALGAGGSFSVKPGLSEEVVYVMAKIFYEHLDEISQMTPYGKKFSIQESLESTFNPFHPGAVKYFKEKGVWNNEIEARQKELLNRVVPAKK